MIVQQKCVYNKKIELILRFEGKNSEKIEMIKPNGHSILYVLSFCFTPFCHWQPLSIWSKLDLFIVFLSFPDELST